MIVNSTELAILEHNEMVVKIKKRCNDLMHTIPYIDYNTIISILIELENMAEFFVQERRRIKNC